LIEATRHATTPIYGSVENNRVFYRPPTGRFYYLGVK